MTVFVDGNPPGCKCGPDCEMPCWQRLGLTDQKCCAGCPDLPKEEPMDQMAEDHSRDYRVKGLFDDARRALNALLEDEHARRRIGHTLEGKAVVLAEKLDEQSAHVVRVWD